MPMGSPVAGRAYHVFCTAAIMKGIHSTPVFIWLNSDGSGLADGDGISAGLPTARSLSLDFSLLRFSQSGVYTCRLTLFSLALQAPMIITTSISIDVQRKFVRHTVFARSDATPI